MIEGVHTIVFGPDADAARAFFRDVLGLSGVDAGGGWLIFALPPAEVAVHPTDGKPGHEMYLMCRNINETVADLEAKGVEFVEPVTDQGWGLVTRLRIPGGGDIGLYQPKHPSPLPTFDA